METFYRSAELAYREGEDGGPGVIEGRAVPYNVWTEIRSTIEGHFLERIKPGALAKTIAERSAKMRVLFEHGFSRTIDKSPIASLEWFREADDLSGADYRAPLLRSVPPLIIDGLRAGLYGTSIAMRMPIRYESNFPRKPSEHNPDMLEERTVTEASIREMSVVTFPAYEGTTATVRSLTDELLVARLAEDPQHLLQLVRAELQAAPEHPEPDAPEPTPEPEEPQDEPEDEPAEEKAVEAGRATQPKPSKDWLSEQEARPQWRLP